MDVAEAGRRGGLKRAAKLSDKALKESAQKASRAFWDSLTPEERSEENKRRAAKRKKPKKHPRG
jgi:hypothetical protein